jgi:hypothetical protein
VQRAEQSLESARRIPAGERCPCPDRFALCVQCVHEYCVAGRLFLKRMWSMRHWQPDAFPADAVGSPRYSQLIGSAQAGGVQESLSSAQGDQPAEAGVDTDEGGTRALSADSNGAGATAEEDEDEDDDNNFPSGSNSSGSSSNSNRCVAAEQIAIWALLLPLRVRSSTIAFDERNHCVVDYVEPKQKTRSRVLSFGLFSVFRWNTFR